MKLIHTQKKSANRTFNKSATGFKSTLERKQFNQNVFNKDKTDKRFSKPKPIRRNQSR